MTNFVQFPGLGIELEVNRIAVSLGSFNIFWYGVLIGAGALLALLFTFKYADEFGINADRMIDVILITGACAIVCARLYYVAFAPFKYDNLWDVINTRDGGLAIYGAVIGAFVFGAIFCKWRKVPILPMYDLAAMGFLIGQSIGRWGNFTNQEAFGINTTLPWGMKSEATVSYLTAMQNTLAAEGVMVDPALPVHPTFLYESLWCALGFVLLLLYVKKRKFDGEILLFYIMWYGVGRFFIEGLRTDSLMISGLGIRTSQLVAALSILAAIIIWAICRKKGLKRAPIPKAVPTEIEVQENINDSIDIQDVQETLTTQETSELSSEKEINTDTAVQEDESDN